MCISHGWLARNLPVALICMTDRQTLRGPVQLTLAKEQLQVTEAIVTWPRSAHEQAPRSTESSSCGRPGGELSVQGLTSLLLKRCLLLVWIWTLSPFSRHKPLPFLINTMLVALVNNSLDTLHKRVINHGTVEWWPHVFTHTYQKQSCEKFRDINKTKIHKLDLQHLLAGSNHSFPQTSCARLGMWPRLFVRYPPLLTSRASREALPYLKLNTSKIVMYPHILAIKL